MTALTVTLEASQELFVDEQVRSGAYADADAVIRAGLDRLKAEAEGEARKEARFRDLIRQANDSVERGDVIHVQDTAAFFDTLEAETAARPA